jgi:ATP-binding cassette subfamily C exporter for protease/lipase
VVLIAWRIVNETCHAQAAGRSQHHGDRRQPQATNNLRNAEVIEAMGMLPNLMGRWFKLHSRFLQCRPRPARRPA